MTPDTPIKAIPVTPTLEDEREAEREAQAALEAYRVACDRVADIKSQRYQAILEEIVG